MKYATLILFFIALSFGVTTARAEASGPVVVVAHPSVPTTDVGFEELRDLFVGAKRYWSGGGRVELIVSGERGPARRTCIERVAHMSEMQFQQHWIAMVFNQRATRAPRVAPSRRLVLALVAAIPGAVALVEAGDVPANVRVLTVSGAAPSDPRYPLR